MSRKKYIKIRILNLIFSQPFLYPVPNAHPVLTITVLHFSITGVKNYACLLKWVLKLRRCQLNDQSKNQHAPLNSEQFREMFFHKAFLKSWEIEYFLSFQPPFAGCSMPKRNSFWGGPQKLPKYLSQVQIFHLWCQTCCQSTLRTYLKKMPWSLLPDWILLQRRIKRYFVTVSMTVCLYSTLGLLGIPLPCISSSSDPLKQG